MQKSERSKTPANQKLRVSEQNEENFSPETGFQTPLGPKREKSYLLNAPICELNNRNSKSKISIPRLDQLADVSSNNVFYFDLMHTRCETMNNLTTKNPEIGLSQNFHLQKEDQKGFFNKFANTQDLKFQNQPKLTFFSTQLFSQKFSQQVITQKMIPFSQKYQDSENSNAAPMQQFQINELIRENRRSNKQDTGMKELFLNTISPHRELPPTTNLPNRRLFGVSDNSKKIKLCSSNQGVNKQPCFFDFSNGTSHLDQLTTDIRRKLQTQEIKVDSRIYAIPTDLSLPKQDLKNVLVVETETKKNKIRKLKKTNQKSKKSLKPEDRN